jgi:hypothetical protein
LRAEGDYAVKKDTANALADVAGEKLVRPWRLWDRSMTRGRAHLDLCHESPQQIREHAYAKASLNHWAVARFYLHK